MASTILFQIISSLKSDTFFLNAMSLNFFKQENQHILQHFAVAWETYGYYPFFSQIKRSSKRIENLTEKL
jgi:hypothetical protein